MTCADVHELAAEVALDLLTGTERAAALAHLEGCTACRSEVGSLTDVGEAVLSLAHEAEPSAGFESRVISRIASLRDAPAPPTPPRPLLRPSEEAPAPGPRPRRRRRRRAALAGAGALAAAAAVVLAVLVVGRGGGDTVEAAVDLRTEAGRVVGEATLTDDDPAVVTLDMSDWMAQVRRYGDPDRSYWLTVDSGGAEDDVYALPTGEDGPWHVRLDAAADVDVDAVASVAVVDDTGRALCEARFPGP